MLYSLALLLVPESRNSKPSGGGYSWIKQDIYVDATNGNDNNDGSSTSPVKTFTGINRLLANPAHEYTLYFKRGTYDFLSYYAFRVHERAILNFVILDSQAVTFTSSESGGSYIGIPSEFKLEVRTSATLTLNETLGFIHGLISKCRIVLWRNATINGSGGIGFGSKDNGIVDTVDIILSGGCTISIPSMTMNAGATNIYGYGSGTNTISTALYNNGPGIMMPAGSVNVTGTMSGPRIVNNTFYPS